MTAKIVAVAEAEVVVETPDAVLLVDPAGGGAVVELSGMLIVVDRAASVVPASEDDEHPRASMAANRSRTSEATLDAVLGLLSLVPPP